MIEHLREREKSLEPFGWRGREAEWVALVCLHSGVFTRTQWCHYFNDPTVWLQHVSCVLFWSAAMQWNPLSPNIQAARGFAGFS